MATNMDMRGEPTWCVDMSAADMRAVHRALARMDDMYTQAKMDDCRNPTAVQMYHAQRERVRKVMRHVADTLFRHTGVRL